MHSPRKAGQMLLTPVLRRISIMMLTLLMNLVSLSAHASPLEPVSLDQLYASAIQNTSVLKDKIHALAIAREKKIQGLSKVLPTLSIESSQAWRDPVDVGAFGEASQNTTKIALTQPLFQGGSEFAALSITKRLPEIAELEKDQTAIQFYFVLAERFFTILRLKSEAALLKEQEEILRSRVSTLRKRAEIGRNRLTDVLSAESQLARIRAELGQSENSLIAERQKLKNLTGLKTIPALALKQDPEALVVPPDWDKRIEKNPQLGALELQVENARKRISISQSEFYPSVDLAGNYYLNRAGILSDSKWDVTLTATWNLYNGGSDSAAKRIQTLEVFRLEESLNEIKRNLNNEFLALKEEFGNQKEVITRLKRAVRLARQNYQQHLQEVQQGLVNQLDVLRSLEELLQVQRAFDFQRFHTQITWVKLRTLAGVKP